MEKLKENIPLLTILIIGLGYFRLKIYYNEFDIEIYNYIQLSEILTSFLDYLTAFTILLVILIGGLLTNTVLSDKPTGKDFKSSLNNFYNKNIGTVILAAVFGGIYGAYQQYDKTQDTKAALGMILISALVIALISVFHFTIRSEFVDKTLSKIFLVSFILMTVIGGALFLGKVEAKNKKEEYKVRNYIIQTDSKVITTNKSIIYIGKTENFYFLYNDSLKETSIFNKDQIRTVKVKVNYKK